jgi:hypothetical protein
MKKAPDWLRGADNRGQEDFIIRKKMGKRNTKTGNYAIIRMLGKE